MDALPPPASTSDAIRTRLLHTLHRDLVGPNLDDADLMRELLPERPSRWCLTGFIEPDENDGPRSDAPAAEADLLGEDVDGEGEPAPDPVIGCSRAEDNGDADPGASGRRMQATSLGLTLLLSPEVEEVEALVTWGDYQTEPPLPPEVLTDEAAKQPFDLHWRRQPRAVRVRLTVPPDGPAAGAVPVPGSAAPQLPGGGLALVRHARSYDVRQPDGTVERVRALTVVLVNRRRQPGRRFLDVACAFQVRLELRCPQGFLPRRDMSGHWSNDPDRRLADLHYRNVAEYAVGRASSAGWTRDDDGVVRAVWTDPLPQAEVERVVPNEEIGSVTWGMEQLATIAAAGADALQAALAGLPSQYAAWIAGQAAAIPAIPGPRRQETAAHLVEGMRRAQARIEAGIALLATDGRARLAFAAMNEALARAARQRNAQGGSTQPCCTDPTIGVRYRLGVGGSSLT